MKKVMMKMALIQSSKRSNMRLCLHIEAVNLVLQEVADALAVLTLITTIILMRKRVVTSTTISSIIINHKKMRLLSLMILLSQMKTSSQCRKMTGRTTIVRARMRRNSKYLLRSPTKRPGVNLHLKNLLSLLERIRNFQLMSHLR